MHPSGQFGLEAVTRPKEEQNLQPGSMRLTSQGSKSFAYIHIKLEGGEGGSVHLSIALGPDDFQRAGQ